MKNMKTLLLVSAAAILGLVSCGGDGTSIESGDDATSSVSTATTSASASASSIESTLTSYPFTVGEAVDLDDYITVNYSDGTSDKAYTVSSSSSAVSIEDHIVTFTAAGTFTLSIVSEDGNRDIRVYPTAKTAETMEIIEFLYPITENPDNFTYNLYQIGYNYNIQYYASMEHTDRYTAIYNVNDWDAYISAYGEYSWIMAILNDGYYYSGSFTADNDVEFDPGIISNGANYYIRLSNTLDPLDFDEYTDSDGETYVAGGTSVSESLFYNLSFGTDYTFGPAQILGWIDNDGDGEGDELILVPTFYDEEYGTYTYYSNVIVGITAIGTTENELLEKACYDDSYIPDAIESDDLSAALSDLAAADNYTVDIGVYAYNTSTGEYYEEIPESHFLYSYTGLTNSLEQTNKVTTDGIYSEVTKYGEDNPCYEFAYFNSNGQGYAYANGTDPIWTDYSYDNQCEEIVGVTDVFEYDLVTQSLASNIDSSSVSGLNFTGYSQNNGYQTWTADLGDYDGTTQTNGLFVSLFDQFSVFSTTYGNLGTYLGGLTWFTTTDGGYASMTVSGAYRSINVYEDGSISISCYIVEPTSSYTTANSYAYLTYTFQAESKGTTQVDFTSLLA